MLCRWGVVIMKGNKTDVRLESVKGIRRGRIVRCPHKLGLSILALALATLLTLVVATVDTEDSDAAVGDIIKNGDCKYEITAVPIGESHGKMKIIADPGYKSLNWVTIVASVKIPESGGTYDITEIGDGAFYSCDSLKSLNLLNAAYLKIIGEQAFKECTSLTSLNFEGASSLEEIGTFAFAECEGLKSLDLSGAIHLKTIGDYAFQSCVSIDGTVTIPPSVTSIGISPFGGCISKNLRFAVADGNPNYSVLNGFLYDIAGKLIVQGTNVSSAIIGSNVVAIGPNAFFKCDLLTSLNLSDASILDTIGSGAFYKCGKLTLIEIPAGVVFIGEDAFNGCTSVKTVKFASADKPTVDNHAFSFGLPDKHATVNIVSEFDASGWDTPGIRGENTTLRFNAQDAAGIDGGVLIAIVVVIILVAGGAVGVLFLRKRGIAP